jgi:hypothetical protein
MKPQIITQKEYDRYKIKGAIRKLIKRMSKKKRKGC